MAYTQQDWTQAIAKLTEWTSREKVKWDVCRFYEEDTGDEVERAFEALHASNRYVLKKSMRRVYQDEEEYSWDGPFYTLEIYRKHQLQFERLAVAPALPITRSLYQKVEALFVFQQGALDDLLKGDIFD